jgi:hypothetical protein
MRWEQRVPRPSQRNKEAWRGVAVGEPANVVGSGRFMPPIE